MDTTLKNTFFLMKKGFFGLEKWAQALRIAPIGFLASFYAISKKKFPNSDIRAQSYGISKFLAYIKFLIINLIFTELIINLIVYRIQFNFY
jgi:hypothetical protein